MCPPLLIRWTIIQFVPHTKWLLTFTERYVCYYCLLAVNHDNYTRGHLKNLGEILSLTLECGRRIRFLEKYCVTCRRSVVNN
jgi:hypothetical protein